MLSKSGARYTLRCQRTRPCRHSNATPQGIVIFARSRVTIV
jgi:hypothetical protein